MSLSPDNFVMSQVALLAWQDGHKEGHNAMVAIMFVIANRVRAKWEDGNWLAVVQSLRRTGRGSNEYPDARDPGFQQLLTDVDAVYDGAEDILTDGALYYFAPQNMLDPGPTTPPVAKIGNLSFFR